MVTVGKRAGGVLVRGMRQRTCERRKIIASNIKMRHRSPTSARPTRC